MTRDERDELIWLYAAGSLGDTEVRAVRALLEAGEADDLAALSMARETLARLPEALDGIEPPDTVLARLMKRIGPPDRSGPESPVVGPSRRWVLPTLLSAAAACVAVFSVMSAMNARSDADRTRAQLDEALAALEAMRSQSAAEQKELRDAMETQRLAIQTQRTESARQVEALMAQTRLLYTADLRFTSLAGQDLPGGGRVVWDLANRQAHVFVFDLAPPAAGRVYQLWFIGPDNASHPAGTFNIDPQGKGHIVAPIPEGPLQSVAISEEPAAGSAAPTLPIKLSGTVQ